RTTGRPRDCSRPVLLSFRRPLRGVRESANWAIERMNVSVGRGTMMRWSKACLVLGILASTAGAGDWPAWRGPTGQGVSEEKDLPLKWSATENVRWKVPLSAPGNSTPIIWGDRVFITQASDKTLW